MLSRADQERRMHERGERARVCLTSGATRRRCRLPPGRRLPANVKVMLDGISIPRLAFTAAFAITRSADWIVHARATQDRSHVPPSIALCQTEGWVIIFFSPRSLQRTEVPVRTNPFASGGPGTACAPGAARGGRRPFPMRSNRSAPSISICQRRRPGCSSQSKRGRAWAIQRKKRPVGPSRQPCPTEARGEAV